METRRLVAFSRYVRDEGVASPKHSLHHGGILSMLLSVHIVAATRRFCWRARLSLDFARDPDPFDSAQGHPEPVERMSLSNGLQAAVLRLAGPPALYELRRGHECRTGRDKGSAKVGRLAPIFACGHSRVRKYPG